MPLIFAQRLEHGSLDLTPSKHELKTVADAGGALIHTKSCLPTANECQEMKEEEGDKFTLC